MNIKGNKEAKRNMVHALPRVDADHFKEVFLVCIVDEHKPVKKTEEHIEEEEDKDVVKD